MKYPNFGLEKKLFKQGYQYIAAIDEVGRGAWAGPLVAAAIILDFQLVTFPKKLPIKKLEIKDSKLLPEKIREKIFRQINKKVIWSAGIVSHEEIDHYGLSWANQQAIFRALDGLPFDPDYLLLDMIKGFKHSTPFNLIIDGDRKIFSIALASILAKVTRDHLMKKYHRRFPHYHFAKNKGYGTSFHFLSIKKYGVCPLHRRSFLPIKKLSG